MRCIVMMSAAALTLSGCFVLEEGEELGAENIGTEQEELLGGVRFTADCSASDQQLFRDAMGWGRAASMSTAFQECMASRMQNYYPCNGDPHATATRAVQTQRVIEASRSDNDLRISCPSAGGDAWAPIGTWGHSNEEQMSFKGLLDWARARVLIDPVNAYAGLAGTVWHEAMHTHGYLHGSSGGGNPAGDRAECGVPANVNPWEVVPYAVGSCLSEVIRQSKTVCGANTCGATGKRLVTHHNGASCACVNDPWLDASLWSPRYADSSATTTAERLSIQYTDVNGDGQDDLCGLEGTSVRCSGSSTVGFDAAAQNSWDIQSSGWNVTFADYRATLAFPDLNRDNRSDVCMRQSDGIYCALTSVTCNGSACIPSFGARWRLVNGFGDNTSWHTHRSYWETVQFADVNGDQRDDVCGRGEAGVYCSLTLAQANGTITGSQLVLMASVFSNANNWNSHESYWRTIRIVNVSGDGKADVCGRGDAGIHCGHYRPAFRDFGQVRLRTSNFSDPWWRDPMYYETIEYGDLNGDGAIDVCGRGDGGMYCGLYGGANEPLSQFNGVNTLDIPEFSDANGWNTVSRYTTLRLADVNGDSKADVCGRGANGITCVRSSSVLVTSFAAPELWVKNFGDNFGWGANQTHYRTVKPAKVSRANPGGSAFCGRGWAGIYCSRR